ncbi:putative reverse transcriptase domain-containing protein [Tanacetum coccineum]
MDVYHVGFGILRVNKARGADEELSDGGPEHPPSPNYVPGPEHPPLPIEVPYVPEPEYPEYLVPSDAEAPLEDQPLPADASPTALSLGYMADSDLEEDLEEYPEEDHADYPADGGDDNDEPSGDDDDDTVDEDEEPFKDEDDDEEEEEHLALADSFAVLVVDHVPSAWDTKEFETDESTPTPRSPQTKIPSPPLPPPQSSPHLPPHVPTSLPLPSSPLPPLPVLLFIPPLVNHREDIPEAELPPCKRLCLTAPTSRYEVGKSSTAAPRPTRGHRADYGFIGTMGAEISQRAEEVSYGIRDVWVDPTEAVEEVAPTTLKGVNARVIELAAVQEQDTQDIYADTYPDAGLPYRLTGVTDDDIDCTYFITTGTVISGIWDRFRHFRLETRLMQMIPRALNNMLPRRSFATARATAAAAAAAPMTATAVEQLIEARVSAVLANHETLRHSTYGHGDESHNSDTGTRGTFATCTFLGNALTWWNFHMKTVTQDVAYAMDWKALKKMMTVKYSPMGDIKKLEIELWNLKVKGIDVASYILRFQELALMCGRMFHEESEEVEKYVGGLPDMI